MSRRSAGAILFCTLFPLLCSVAQAQPKLQPRQAPAAPPAQQAPAAGMIDGIAANMEAVLPLIKQAPGISNVEMFNGNNNYKAVRAQFNQTWFLVGPEICKDGVCKGLVFFANLGKQQNIDLGWLNAWNSKKVFGRAYLDKDGNIIFDLAIHFWGGVNPRYITETADLYGVLLKSLFEFQPDK